MCVSPYRCQQVTQHHEQAQANTPTQEGYFEKCTAMTPQLLWQLLSGNCHFSKQAAATQSHGSLYLPSTMSLPQSRDCFASPAGRMDCISSNCGLDKSSSSSCGPDKPFSSMCSCQVNLVPAALKVTMHLIFLNNYSKTACHISAYVFPDLNIAQP